jgi:hypothetical protein
MNVIPAGSVEQLLVGCFYSSTVLKDWSEYSLSGRKEVIAVSNCKK